MRDSLNYNHFFEKGIPSKAVRDYCSKLNHNFNCSELATLIFNNSTLFWTELDMELLSLSDFSLTEEPENSILRNQIKERLAYDKFLQEKYFAEEPEQFYKIEIPKQDFQEETCFSTLSAAFDFYLKECDKTVSDYFYIIKCYLNQKDVQIYGKFKSSLLEKACPDTSDLLSLSCWKIETIEFSNKRFEFAFIDVPFPFRKGDLVKSIGSSDIGLMNLCKDEEDYKRFKEVQAKIKKKLPTHIDITDVSLNVEYLYHLEDKNTFSHDHPYIPLVEYAVVPEDNPDYDLLCVAQDLLKGKGSLEVFLMHLNKQN